MTAEIKDSVYTLAKMYYGDKEGDKSYKRWYSWFTEIHNFDKAYVESCFKAVTPVNGDAKFDYDEIIAIRNIDVDLVCPHHWLPVEMTVHIAYLPDKQVLGLSKFARIAKEFGKPPKMQEEYTEMVARSIHAGLNARWTMVIAVGKHGCMRCRGVKSKGSDVVTSYICGKSNFTDSGKSLKNEFLHLTGIAK